MTPGFSRQGASMKSEKKMHAVMESRWPDPSASNIDPMGHGGYRGKPQFKIGEDLTFSRTGGA